MRILIITVASLLIAIAAVVGVGIWRYARLFPKPSAEVVELTLQKRQTLQRLQAEAKFQPNEYPPLGYTGPETPEEKATATAAVDKVVAAVLSQPGDSVRARDVAALIKSGMKSVFPLPTEDRDRTQGYMLEVWYILGFRGPTGLFIYGSAYPKPVGYGEPLPPGWTAPDKPRRIG